MVAVIEQLCIALLLLQLLFHLPRAPLQLTFLIQNGSSREETGRARSREVERAVWPEEGALPHITMGHSLAKAAVGHLICYLIPLLLGLPSGHGQKRPVPATSKIGRWSAAAMGSG